MNMKQGPVLHNRATSGEKLTREEEQLLTAWQAELDRDESMVLFGSESPPKPTTNETSGLEPLQQQIDDLLVQLTEKTKHLQTVMEQNKLLRQEIDILRTQI